MIRGPCWYVPWLLAGIAGIETRPRGFEFPPFVLTSMVWHCGGDSAASAITTDARNEVRRILAPEEGPAACLEVMHGGYAAGLGHIVAGHRCSTGAGPGGSRWEASHMGELVGRRVEFLDGHVLVRVVRI